MLNDMHSSNPGPAILITFALFAGLVLMVLFGGT